MTGIGEIEPFRLVKAARKLLKPSIDRLTALVDSNNDDVAIEALQALGKIGEPASRQILQDALDHFPDRVEPLNALGQFRDSTPVPRLLGLLDDQDYQLKEDVVRVLGEIGDPQATDALKRLLHDSERMVRYYAAWALYRIGGRDVVESLCGLLSDPDEWIVINVLEILSRLKEPAAVPALAGQFKISRDPRLKAIIVSSLAAFAEPQLLPVFEEGLASFDPRIQANSVEAIAMLKISPLEVKRKLKKFLTHPNNRVRANAAIALFKSDPEKAGSEIEAMIRNPDVPTRRSAAWALARVQVEKRNEMIDRLLADSAFGVRKMALKAALALETEVGVGRILPLLKDKNPWVRKEAVDCARKIKEVQAQPLLEAFTTENSPPVLESLLDFMVERRVEKGIPLIVQKVRAQPEEGLPKLLSSLGRLNARKELLEVRKHLAETSAEVMREFFIALLLHGELQVLSELHSMLAERIRDDERLSTIKVVGEVGAFLRATDGYSPRLTESLFAEARKDMDGVVEFGPPPGSVQAEPESIDKGMKLLQEGKADEAERFFTAFIKGNPGHPEALFQLAGILARSGRHADAQVSLESLLQISPAHVNGALMLGQSLFQLKNWQRLIEVYEKLREALPTQDRKVQGQVLGALGLAYFHLRRYPKAVDMLSKALTINPRDLSSSYHLSLSYVAIREYSPALKLLRSLKSSLPPDSRVLRNVEELLQKLEEEQGA